MLLQMKLPLVGAAKHMCCLLPCTSDGNTKTQQAINSRVKTVLPKCDEMIRAICALNSEIYRHLLLLRSCCFEQHQSRVLLQPLL